MRKVNARRAVNSGYAKRRRQMLQTKAKKALKETSGEPEDDEIPFHCAHDPTMCADMARRMQLRSAPSSASLERIVGWSDAFAFPQKDAKSNAARPPCKPASPGAAQGCFKCTST